MYIKKLEVRQRTWHKHCTQREMNAKPRIYIFQDNYNVLNDLISGDRYNRPHTAYRKLILSQILEQSNYPAGTKVKWSQYAGCSCPCSPGFIVNGIPNKEDVFVTITATAPEHVLSGNSPALSV